MMIGLKEKETPMVSATKTRPFVGEVLLNARKARGWTRPQVAELLGVTLPVVKSWEHGRRTPDGPNRERIEFVYRPELDAADPLWASPRR